MTFSFSFNYLGDRIMQARSLALIPVSRDQRMHVINLLGGGRGKRTRSSSRGMIFLRNKHIALKRAQRQMEYVDLNDSFG